MVKISFGPFLGRDKLEKCPRNAHGSLNRVIIADAITLVSYYRHRLLRYTKHEI